MRPSAKQLLAENGVEAILITKSVNVQYLSRMCLGESLLLVTKNGFMLFVSSLEREAAQKNAPKNVKVVSNAKLDAILQKISSCAFEEEDVSVARLKRWKKIFPGTTFSGTSGMIEKYRRTKDADELRSILTANSITETILEKIPSQLKAGITEQKLSWVIECWARIAGAEKMGFETIVAFGSHTSRPHHHPTTKKLKKGDLVQIDMGVVVDGYTSDRSAVYFTEKPTERQAKVLSALEEAKKAGIEAIKSGVACSEPDRIARSVLKKYGFEKEFIHSLGHGVGLEIHEGVSISSRSKDAFMEHEVVTVEPGVYFEGKWGMRLEDMVIVQ